MYREVISKDPIPGDLIGKWPLKIIIPHWGDDRDRDLAKGQMIEVVAGEEVRLYRIVQNHWLRRPMMLSRREAIAVPVEVASA